MEDYSLKKWRKSVSNRQRRSQIVCACMYTHLSIYIQPHLKFKGCLIFFHLLEDDPDINLSSAECELLMNVFLEIHRKSLHTHEAHSNILSFVTKNAANIMDYNNDVCHIRQLHSWKEDNIFNFWFPMRDLRKWYLYWLKFLDIMKSMKTVLNLQFRIIKTNNRNKNIF